MPDPLNPQADSQYVATLQNRADVAAGQNLVATIEASSPQEKQVALGRYNLDPGRYAQLKGAVGWPLMPEDKQALEQQREQIEGPAPEIEPSNIIGDITHAVVGKNVEAATGSPTAGRVADIVTDLIPAALGLKGAFGAETAAAGATLEGAEGAESGAAAAEGGAATEAAAAPAEEAAAAPAAQEGGAAEKAGAEVAAPGEAAVPAQEARPAEPAAPTEAGAHSDVAAIQNAAANPMSKDEFEKIEFTEPSAPGEHPDLVTPLTWADRFRAMEYGGQLADNAIVARRAAALTGSEEDTAAVEAADQALEEALPRAYAIRHETGLALQKLGASPGAMQLKAVFEAMADNESTPARLSGILANLPTIDERAKMLDDAANLTPANWSAKEAFYNLFVNTRLSLNSVGMKAKSDALMALLQVPFRAVAEAGSRVAEVATGADYGSVGVRPGETGALISGMMENWGNALKVGLDSARQGKPMFEGDVGFFDNPALARRMSQGVMEGSGFENSWWGKAIDYYGHLVSVPGRSILGVDQFSKSMQYNMELDTLIQRTAFDEASDGGAVGRYGLLSNSEISARVNELADGYRAKTPGWMTNQAMQTAKINTFQQDLEGSLAKIDALRRDSYFARTMAPFFKTPVNITLQAIRHSPFAVLSPTVRAAVAGGGPDAALALGKAALGSAIFAYFTDRALRGHMTGAIPANLKGTMRDDWLRDNQPYSIKNADGSWTSYDGIEPISWMMGMAADTAPMWAYLNQGEADHAVGTLARAAVNEMGRQPMWGMLHMIVNAFDDLERGRTSGIGQAGSRMAASLMPMPQSVTNLGGAIDPIRRQSKDLIDDLRNRIPWLKSEGLPTLDSFGRPVIVPPGFMANEFPAYVHAEKGVDPVVDEQKRLADSVGFQVPQIPKAIGGAADSGNLDEPEMMAYGASLTPAEQNKWLEFRNDPSPGEVPKLYDAVAKLMKMPEYQDAADSQRANLLHMVFTGYQHLGQQRMMAEDPGLRARVMAAYTEKAAARRAGPRTSSASVGAP